MRVQVCGVDHQRVSSAALIDQFQQHPGDDALRASPFPAVVKRLVRLVLSRRVLPAQAIAIKKIIPLSTLVVNTRFAVGLGEERLKLGHLLIAHPEKVAYVTAPFFGAVNHAARSKSMHPDPRLLKALCRELRRQQPLR